MNDSETLALVKTNGCHLLCYADEAFVSRLPAYPGDVAPRLNELGLPSMAVKLGSHTHVNFFASIVNVLAPGFPSWRFIDIGGYIGAIGLPVARWASMNAIGKGAHIEIFEPTRMSHLLKESVALNRLEAFVEIHPFAVSNVVGRSIFNSLANQRVAGHLGGVATDTSTMVDTISLDSHYPTLSDELLIIKIDTEGHEPRVLEGMRELLGRNRVVGIIEFHEFCIGYKVGSQTYEQFLFDNFRIFNVGNIGYPKVLQEVARGDVAKLREHANRDGNRLTDLVCFDRRLAKEAVDSIVAPYLEHL